MFQNIAIRALCWGTRAPLLRVDYLCCVVVINVCITCVMCLCMCLCVCLFIMLCVCNVLCCV